MRVHVAVAREGGRPILNATPRTTQRRQWRLPTVETGGGAASSVLAPPATSRLKRETPTPVLVRLLKRYLSLCGGAASTCVEPVGACFAACGDPRLRSQVQGYLQQQPARLSTLKCLGKNGGWRPCKKRGFKCKSRSACSFALCNRV